MSDTTQTPWRRTTFKSICTSLVNGGTPDTDNSKYWNGATPWVTGADFNSRGIGEIRRFVSDAGIRSSSTSVVRAGNLLIVTRTGVGKLAVAPCDIAISQDITGVYLDTSQGDTAFVKGLTAIRQKISNIESPSTSTTLLQSRFPETF